MKQRLVLIMQVVEGAADDRAESKGEGETATAEGGWSAEVAEGEEADGEDGSVEHGDGAYVFVYDVLQHYIEVH